MAIAESPTPKNSTTQPPIRVQVVTRNYWPNADESSLRLMHTLDVWKSAGIHPSILTTRSNHSWPDRATLRNIAVERILPAPTSSWNETHLQRNVAKWLIKNSDHFDALYVDSSDELLATIVAKSKAIGKPILCRFGQEPNRWTKPRSSISTYLQSSVSLRDALRKCHCVISEHRCGYETLIDLGVPKDRAVWLPDSVCEPAERSETLRRMACHAMFQVSGDLAIPTQTNLLLHFGEASFEQLHVALQSVCDLLDRGIPIRMWLINPGSDAGEIYEWLKSQGWHHEILIFDGFDVLEDLVCLADLVIASNPACSLQYSTRLALESNLPMIVAIDPSIPDWMPETPLMKWYHSRASLGSQLQDWLTHRAQWEAEAIALRRHYQSHHPSKHWIDRWLELFRNAVNPIGKSTAEKRTK